MAKILMLTPYLPFPPVSGGRSRTYNLLRELHGRFSVTLVCFGRPEERAYDTGPLGELCELVVVERPSSPSLRRVAWLSSTSVRPVITRLYGSRAFRAAVLGVLARGGYEAIHVESFYMLQNVPDDAGVPVLLCEPAIEYVAWARQARVAKGLPQRIGMKLEARKLRAFEPRAWQRAALVAAMSKLDAASIEQAAPGAAVTVVPNGVDTGFFQTGDGERDAATAVYMGDYSYFPNVDAVAYFVGEIMPLIRARRPDFTLTLLGKDAPPELLALGRDPAAGVRIEGLVEDTRPYLTRASVFVCPLRSASGTRFKLLEAMACGCPVVSSSIGSEGLEATDGVHLRNADSAPAFAAAVLRLLKHRDEAAQLGRDGCAWVRREHTWSRSAQSLVSAYASLASGAGERFDGETGPTGLGNIRRTGVRSS
jgi:glycosyltransferase involved in cell wall biosynthesis